MKKIAYLSIGLLLFCLFGCRSNNSDNIVESDLIGTWEGIWETDLSGNLDEMTVNEYITFYPDGRFEQMFSCKVDFDDWINESDVYYNLYTLGNWSINKSGNVKLAYNEDEFNFLSCRADVDTDRNGSRSGFISFDYRSFISGILGDKVTKSNFEIESEVEPKLTEYFKDMIAGFNKSDNTLSDIKIDDSVLTAKVKHGFFGRKIELHKTGQIVLAEDEYVTVDEPGIMVEEPFYEEEVDDIYYPEEFSQGDIVVEEVESQDMQDIIDAQEQRTVVEEENYQPDPAKVFDAVEQMPEFPGGDVALYNWLSQNIIYPASASEDGIQGRVTVRFVVMADGSIGEAQIMRGRHPDLDKEAIRIVKKLPKFIPGKLNGKPVNVWYTLPIVFRLQN